MLATRAHIELYRTSMEDRGLAASTIDRRLSTVCGYYDSRISTAASAPTQPSTSAGPRFIPPKATAWTVASSRVPIHRRAVRPRSCRVGGAPGPQRPTGIRGCSTNIEDLDMQRGHRTLHIVGKGAKPATIPLVPRTARTIDLAIGERYAGPILVRRDGGRLDRRTAHRWVRAIGKRAGLGDVHPHKLAPRFRGLRGPRWRGEAP